MPLKGFLCEKWMSRDNVACVDELAAVCAKVVRFLLSLPLVQLGHPRALILILTIVWG